MLIALGRRSLRCVSWRRVFTTECDVATKRSILERVSQASASELDSLAATADARTMLHLQSLLPPVTAVVPDPTSLQLTQLMARSMVPFLGFGFVDNFILILAGDYIDITLGVSLGISSMAAAGIGNAISDVAGIGLGGVIEGFATRLGLPDPHLSRAQMALRITRVAHYTGSSVGIFIGCILGMCPLLFLETKEDRLLKPTADAVN
ncbi:hypothetical protein H257_11852 [Aphanomyces astaci]|uniref:Transmembrane protein 65 n=2 Tax=Aphanomyces astaci TaxID=112090 RepID=W4G0U9_APHAT|nr:hypothetical protein H257_11852 [Aphanomyces astaci]ETV73337.1 hypothetical protein H257_11852 [Aphanomyces astaci]RQM21715.1 hypothetical protein B5M09_001518 [Aphanomyces astaci]|eukprot:XP_009837212.1 hypothetical protein H257_11852 [Aphanomyces astaci]